MAQAVTTSHSTQRSGFDPSSVPDYFGFPLSISLHLCSLLIFIQTMPFPEGNFPKSSVLSATGKHWIEQHSQVSQCSKCQISGSQITYSPNTDAQRIGLRRYTTEHNNVRIKNKVNGHLSPHPQFFFFLESAYVTEVRRTGQAISYVICRSIALFLLLMMEQKTNFFMSSRKVYHNMHTIRMRSLNQMNIDRELPPGRPTAVLTGPQQVYVLM